MEPSIANHGSKRDFTIDHKKEGHDGKMSDETSKKPIQESMMINTVPIKISTRDKKKEIKEVGPTRENERRRFILKELEEKKYHFPYSDVPSMLETLLQKKVIKLPEHKCPKEMGCVNDPNYCHYH